jgi:ribokinase
MANIVVVGSINMDIVNRVEKHPVPGQTVKGLATENIPGGKGANQAVAASMSGSDVTMVGAVGNDSLAGNLLASLRGYGVGTTAIAVKEETSGMAFITVDASGENTIM